MPLLHTNTDFARCDVHLATAGRFHALSLAREYARRGRLGSIELVTRPRLRPPEIPADRYFNHLGYGALLAMHRRFSIGLTDSTVTSLVDRAVLKRLRRLAPGIFHGWNGHMAGTFRGLRDSGWLRCVERSCPHNKWQFDLLVEEASLVGLPPPSLSPSLQPAIDELYEADVIVAPSQYSARSYADPELLRKVRVNPLGVNVAIKPLPIKQKRDGITVLMVGNSFLRKGSHWLILAMQLLHNPANRLLIRGDVPAEYKASMTTPQVAIVPPLSRRSLLSLYEQADVFVLPSVDEGFGMVVLEALGYGLPVVVTHNVGSGELLNDTVSRIVPIRNPGCLAQGIVEASLLPENRGRFDAARTEIVKRWTWAACADRMLSHVYSAV
jgi:alpha-maltose-1-phosphate synthase